ncbi:MAG TPA: hypothetical protein VMT76_07245 [Puia sp.]|nr:hypothetical protein [Puia sp.]
MKNRFTVLLLFMLAMICFCSKSYSQTIYVDNINIVSCSDNKIVRSASWMLSDEIAKRTGIKAGMAKTILNNGNVLLLRMANEPVPSNFLITETPALIKRPEAFRVVVVQQNGRDIIIVEGSDERGVLYGAGYLLRNFVYADKKIGLRKLLAVSSAPDKPMRGHQLGYRNTANSYDAWTVAQFEQYIRELVIFGTNSIESIPIFDERESPHFKMAPDEMNAKISGICDKYGLDYWIWIPAQFNLTDTVKRNLYLAHVEMICRMSVRLNGIFFPGGDPGDNPPETVLPLMEDMSVIIKKFHPHAKLWLSLQGFTPAQSQTVYRYIKDKTPEWLGGLVTGPSSPPVEETRAALPAIYQLRYYPDLTHNVRSDFPVPYWDPFFNFTLGRESVNPRPMHYSALYHFLRPYMDGFISYSDGVHDDVNKITWTELAWDPNISERDILKHYTNFFFGSNLKDEAADGILALESNWQGPAATNGSVETTLTHWRQMEKKFPALANNWRWQMCLLRANYDDYSRKRGIYESELEEQANDVLRQATSIGAVKAMDSAEEILKQATEKKVDTLSRNNVIALCEKLYHSIGLQTSVKKYKASGEERGAVLDFIDYPLNNRWWLEDKFAAIRKLPETEQEKELIEIANWEHPAAGSYYDDIGNISKSPHVLRGESWVTDPLMRKEDNPNFDWWDNGFSRKRQSWMSSMRWPLAVEYNGLDSTAGYVVRVTGYNECLLKINGQRVSHTLYGKEIGEIKEFPVPHELIRDRKISVTFDDIDESNINWRKQSRITEIWLIKKAL